MTWWLWILFWIVFTLVALAYLGWRCYRLWPHAQEFGRALSKASQQLDTAMNATNSAGAQGSQQSTALDVRRDWDDLAWNKSAAQWRKERATAKKKRAEHHLDDHAEVWATWNRRVD